MTLTRFFVIVNVLHLFGVLYVFLGHGYLADARYAARARLCALRIRLAILRELPLPHCHVLAKLSLRMLKASIRRHN